MVYTGDAFSFLFSHFVGKGDGRLMNYRKRAVSFSCKAPITQRGQEEPTSESRSV